MIGAFQFSRCGGGSRRRQTPADAAITTRKSVDRPIGGGAGVSFFLIRIPFSFLHINGNELITGLDRSSGGDVKYAVGGVSWTGGSMHSRHLLPFRRRRFSELTRKSQLDAEINGWIDGSIDG